MNGLKRFFALRLVRRWLIGLALTVVVVALVLVSTAGLWLPAIGSWLAVPAQVAPADVIAVHGGNYRRSVHGVALYRRGLAPEYWHTGYANTQVYVTAFAQQHGIPPEDFHWLTTDSTWTDARRIIARARQQEEVESILVVTDWWHSRRTMCALRHQPGHDELTLYFDPAPPVAYKPDNWWQHSIGRHHVLSELGKFGYYWLRYGMAPWNC